MQIEDKIILSMIQGYSVPCIIYAACKLNILDALYNTKISRKELSERIHGDYRTINLLVDALIVHGFIEEHGDILEATNIGMRLAGQEEDSLKGLAIFAGQECIPAWLKIADAIENHTSPFNELNKVNFFDNIKSSNRSESFVKMMGSVSKQLDFSEYLKQYNPEIKMDIVDIGGGTGEIISKFLKYFTNAKGVILDLGHVKNRAIDNLKDQNLSERCVFQEGSFFEPYDISGNIFILSRILHDWEDKEAEVILKNLRKNMNYNSKLLIIEKVMPDMVEKKNASLFITALHIWALCGGMERTQKGYEELLGKADMEIQKKYYLDDGNYLLEVVLRDDSDEGVL